MQTSEVREPIEQYEAAFRALIDGAVAHGPARPGELDEETESADSNLEELLTAYIDVSNALAERLLGSDDDDTYSAAAAIRRTLAVIGGDFLAAQMIAGLAADQTLILSVLEEEFARPFGLRGSIALLGQTLLVDGLPSVSAGLRGLEQIGAADAAVTRDELVDTADLVVEDVFKQGADLVSKAVHAAIPGSQLIGWGMSLFRSFPVILDPLPQVRGWLANAARRLLESAREKIMNIFSRFVANGPRPLEQVFREQSRQLLDKVSDFATDHLIESGLRHFYDIDGLRRAYEAGTNRLDPVELAIAFEKLEVIPGHAKSWLRWGGYGASALGMAAPLLHGSAAGIPVPIIVGSLIVLYALWVTHDHLGWPPWWRSLPQSRGVLPVL